MIFPRLHFILFVTSPLHESRLLWIHDPHHNQPPRVTPRQTVISEKHDSVPRNNQQTVPRNNPTVPRNNKVVKHSDARARAPLENIPSSSWYNSNLSSVSNSRSSVCNPVPRTNLQRNNETIPVQNQQLALLSPLREKGIESIEGRGVRERERKEVRHLFMMRAGPVSAQETHPVPAFQHK